MARFRAEASSRLAATLGAVAALGLDPDRLRVMTTEQIIAFALEG